MSALLVWTLGTIILLIAAIARNKVQSVRLLPDKELLGGSGIRLVANICAVIPILTTSYSCQAAAPFVVRNNLKFHTCYWSSIVNACLFAKKFSRVC